MMKLLILIITKCQSCALCKEPISATHCVSLASAQEDHTLFEATRNGNAAAVKRLLEGAADVNCEDVDLGLTPLNTNYGGGTLTSSADSWERVKRGDSDEDSDFLNRDHTSSWTRECALQKTQHAKGWIHTWAGLRFFSLHRS
jgi:hypothetical protein